MKVILPDSKGKSTPASLRFEAPYEVRFELVAGEEVKRLAKSFKLHSPGIRENIKGTIGLTPQGNLSIHMEASC